GAWFAGDAPNASVVHKEDALIGEEWLTIERDISPPLGRYFTIEHRFIAAYDNLCRVDVLPWIAATPPAADLIFNIFDDTGARSPDAGLLEAEHGPRVARVLVPLRSVAH